MMCSFAKLILHTIISYEVDKCNYKVAAAGIFAFIKVYFSTTADEEVIFIGIKLLRKLLNIPCVAACNLEI